MVYVLTILAALIVGLGTVVEQRAASQAPPEYNLSVKLLLWLVRRRLWLLGVACSLVGNIVFASALGSGNVALVEAIYLARLLFALAIATVWRRQRPTVRDVMGALAISLGLVAFVLATQPREGSGEQVTVLAWAIFGGSLVLSAVVLAAVAARMGPLRKALLLGIGGGVLFGLQASLTHTAVGVLAESGPLAIALTWQGYAVIAVAVLGMLLVQSAYEAAPLSASYPAIVTGQLLIGMGLGVWLLGGEIQRSVAGLAVGSCAIAVMIAGIHLLTTSPLLTGQLDQLTRQQDVGRAKHIEGRLERELRRADQDAARAESRLTSEPSWWYDRRLQRESDRIEAGMDRLQQLQEDIRRHREQEAEQVGTGERSPEGHETLDEHHRELREQERKVDDRGRQLQETAERLTARRRTHASSRPPDRHRSGPDG